MADISATLFVESTTHSFEEMLSTIGVPSNSGWRKGDPRGRTGKVFITDSWAITARQKIEEDVNRIEKAIQSVTEQVLFKIRGHEKQFSEIAGYGISGLRISIVSKLLPPCILPAHLLHEISRLGVELEVEISEA
jgi:hypothetical protein